jgi:hypothetical protein
MKKALILCAIALFTSVPALFGQDFDFKTLDKLGAAATSSTNVTLNANLLKLAAGLLGNDDKNDAGLKSLVSNLKGIYVRSYEFDKPGQYAESDLAPLRAFLKQPKWSAVVDVREKGESTQVYFLETDNNKLGGVAVVSTEPTALTVIYINGEISREDLEKLSGNMGIPDIKGLANIKPDKKTPK